MNIFKQRPRLSQLVDHAAKGAPFVIAKGGKPLVTVTAQDALADPQRLGFLSGEFAVPDNSTPSGRIGSRLGSARASDRDAGRRSQRAFVVQATLRGP